MKGQRYPSWQRPGLFLYQTPSRHCPLSIQSWAAVGVDEKEEKLLDKKKFEKKKVSEIFKLESDIIETAAHGSVHSNLFKLGA